MSTSLVSAAKDFGFTGNNVLVTGGAGFVGSHLVDALVQANSVTVLDNLSSGTLENVHPQATVVEGDIRDRETVASAMDGVDVVFHQAGFVSVAESVDDPAESHSNNVAGTISVLESAREVGSRVVAASSAAVYGHPSSVPIPESAQPNPSSPYGVDKFALEQYTDQYNTLHDVPTVVLRYFNVYGPRQSATTYSGVISTFLQQAVRGEQLTVHGDGTQTRDFVHVSDVVRANILAAVTPNTGDVFNVGTGVETSVNDLARAICEVVGRDEVKRFVDGRPGDIDSSCADTDKASQLLDFEARVGLTEGLETLLPPEYASA